MSILKAVMLGIIQGLTEFLPVSSSGHLVITQHLLPDFQQPGVAFDVTLHCATLLAVIIYFQQDIRALAGGLFSHDRDLARQKRLMFGLLLLATLPTGLIGFLGRDLFVALFEQVKMVGIMLLVTGLLLWVANTIRNNRKFIGEINWKDALMIGTVQGLAIIPGISRSGSTIATAILRGIDGREAARFSFLLSIPAIIGAVVLSYGDLTIVPISDLPAYLAGATAAFITGVAALKILLITITRHRLKAFAWYCFALGLITLAAFR
ncbi:MAG: undecaprenyl-diphosphate phosphatase [Deltaproteobacteria bacterium]|nr:undecaprenyl-diphosphate phosphatase [Candidatus Anaeroferrophillus wilburensis]MBN2889951.1 undecaprenyl-diphosphate phosphatase [Deltaproteobacteria bacterium]